MTTLPQLLPVSLEFAALCQQQLKLLALSVDADWSILYVAQPNQESQEIALQVISSYPDRLLGEGEQITETEIREPTDFSDFSVLPDEAEMGAGFVLQIGAESPTAFPLFHEDLVLGMLATGRRERPWQSPEIRQIELISQSLSLACVLDQQKSWSTQQLAQQQHMQELEQEHFHDLLHQLRNPTMAISTFGKLLLKRLEENDRNFSVADGVVRESDRLKSLLQQFGDEVNLLDAQIAKMPAAETLALPPNADIEPVESVEMAIALEPLDLVELLRPILTSMAAIAEDKNIGLRADIEGEFSLVWGNINALTEVVSNLIENAIKYTPTYGQVLIQLRTVHGHGQLSVHDTGCGIPSQDLPRVFERHYRGQQAEGDIPGTGLGLAIAHDLVEKIGGDLEVDSPTLGLPHTAKYPGSTFTLWLRIADELDDV